MAGQYSKPICLWEFKEENMKKRFRDENGQLTVTLAELHKLTEKEGREYYQPGNIYLNKSDNRKYVYLQPTESDGELAHFMSVDGYNLFIPIANFGTFLPDVASDGMELVKVA